MKIIYSCQTNSLKCDRCGKEQELPSCVYGNPDLVITAKEAFGALHSCVPRPKVQKPLLAPRRVVPTARAVAEHVLGIKQIA